MLKKLFSHTVIYGLAMQISSIAGIITLPIITKDLTELDFGVWGILMAYVSAFQALSTLGMNVVISNALIKMPSQYKWYWRQIYGFLILWSIPYCIVLGITLWLILPVEAQSNSVLILGMVLLPQLLFGPTAILGTYYFQLNQRPKPIAIRTFFLGILSAILNVYTISVLKMGYMGWLWTNFIITILMNVSYWYPININLGLRPIFNFKWRLIKQGLHVSVPTIPHKYAAFLLNSSDRIVMDRMKIDVSELGEYNIAARFGRYFGQLAMAANRAVGPMMLRLYKKKKIIMHEY